MTDQAGTPTPPTNTTPAAAPEDAGATGTVQDAANRLVDEAQTIANSVVDVGEEAIGAVLGTLVRANRLLGDALEGLADRVAGDRADRAG